MSECCIFELNDFWSFDRKFDSKLHRVQKITPQYNWILWNFFERKGWINLNKYVHMNIFQFSNHSFRKIQKWAIAQRNFNFAKNATLIPHIWDEALLQPSNSSSWYWLKIWNSINQSYCYQICFLASWSWFITKGL